MFMNDSMSDDEHYNKDSGSEYEPLKNKYYFYKKVFFEEFNLLFWQPRSDTCSQCDRLENCIKATDDPSELDKLQKEKEMHLRKAKQAYTLLKNLTQQSKTDKTMAMYTIGFQQNLPSPTLHSNDMFYSRMLWTYNFGRHDCKLDQWIMHLWNETVGKKGSS